MHSILPFFFPPSSNPISKIFRSISQNLLYSLLTCLRVFIQSSIKRTRIICIHFAQILTDKVLFETQFFQRFHLLIRQIQLVLQGSYICLELILFCPKQII